MHPHSVAVDITADSEYAVQGDSPRVCSINEGVEVGSLSSNLGVHWYSFGIIGRE